jgi:hypothetical protein
MASVPQSPPSPSSPDKKSGSGRAEPRGLYRAALARYKSARLAAIRLAQGGVAESARIRPLASADEITEHLDQGAVVDALIGRLANGPRLALSIFALTEATSIPAAALMHTLGILGASPVDSIVRLLDLGLAALETPFELGQVDEFEAVLAQPTVNVTRVRIHPAVPSSVRTAVPANGLPTSVEVSQLRESDGLEPLLRLGALWQRVGIEPLRQTNQGTLYKRDRERVEEDPVLAGPVADAPGPLPDSAALWLALARRVGLIERDPQGDRLLAAASEYWSDNAVHLPQMIAGAWMSLESWQESDGAASAIPAPGSPHAVPCLRIAVMLWLAALEPDQWVALDDLAKYLSGLWPRWDRTSFADDGPPPSGVPRKKPPRGRTLPGSEAGSPGIRLLETLLLGAAYSLGLVRSAEERITGRKVVQLTALGRYALAVGPTPPPRMTFEHFLFVQPNFEMIAYRQGLTPQLVGWLSRFAWWTQIGAALELKLTRESIVHGLDMGSTPESILERLTRHSQRPLPPGVVDAVRNWATRRERVTYYPAATLIEFGSARERDQALASWPASGEGGATDVADRFLLVADDRTVPFDRLRLVASRDYRRPPEECMLVDADGVTMSLDPARSDLLVDAELLRFADELPASAAASPESRGPAPRRFVVSVASLKRGLARGMTAGQLADWYLNRTGERIPPAVKLLLVSKITRIPPLVARRVIVVNFPSTELLDGLFQHPDTRPLLGERLGNASACVADDQVEPLRKALEQLGISLEIR